MQFKKKVAYYYDDIIGTFNYSNGHPMKPLRVAMTDELIQSYGMYNYMDVFFCETYMDKVTPQTLTTFHSDEYINLIKLITPENKSMHQDQLYRCSYSQQVNFRDDCPVMSRLYDFCITYTTGSTAGAALLASKKINYAINWSGGLHHAKQSQASGFCYINDCVLGICQLLKVFQRVLYVDIDIHHGDGVEQAFYLTDRVMTCSFHKFKDYFPGTGHIDDIGKDDGKYHAVNFPLDQGLDDQSFAYIIKPVLKQIMDRFRPEAIVLQGGADSLSGDRLGCFNLSVKGHGQAVKFLKTYNVPMMLLGGGGYTLRNVPRCWTYQTSNQMPQNQYYIYFAPEYKLHLPISNMENQNSKAYLDKTIQTIFENLRRVSSSSVQINVNDNQTINKVDMSEVINEYNDKMIDQKVQ